MRRAFVTAILAAAFGLTAALVDAEPLWVPAATLLAIAAGSAAWVGFGARGVRITRTLGARRVMEDEPVTIVLDVRAGRLGLPPSRIADPLMPATVALRGGTGGGRVRIEARFERRGRRSLALPSVLVADPLGLATREVSARPSPLADEILVLPRIEPVVAAPGGGDASRLARHGLPVGGAEVQLDGIRPLRDGTPASRIFWPAVARGADPQERFLAAASESRPVVVLDPRGAAGDEALDAAVRAAASLARALAEAGGCAVLLPGDRRAAARRSRRPRRARGRATRRHGRPRRAPRRRRLRADRGRPPGGSRWRPRGSAPVGRRRARPPARRSATPACRRAAGGSHRAGPPRLRPAARGARGATRHRRPAPRRRVRSAAGRGSRRRAATAAR